MILRYSVPFIIAFALPFLAFAQSTATQDAALREAIRADIMADPRSSEMSATDIDAMVEALAAQSEDQGTAQQYLEMRNSFGNQPPPVYDGEVSTSEWNPMSIAIAALLFVLLGVAGFLIWHRRNRTSLPV